MRWLRTRQSFKKTRQVKKLALTTYFIKSKEELGCVILSVFSTVKWWSSFFNIFRPKSEGHGPNFPPPSTPAALIYTIESMVCCLRLPNMLRATYYQELAGGIGANILNE